MGDDVILIAPLWSIAIGGIGASIALWCKTWPFAGDQQLGDRVLMVVFAVLLIGILVVVVAALALVFAIE